MDKFLLGFAFSRCKPHLLDCNRLSCQRENSPVFSAFGYARGFVYVIYERKKKQLLQNIAKYWTKCSWKSPKKQKSFIYLSRDRSGLKKTACSSRWKGPSSVSLKGGDWLSKISVKLTPSCVLAKIRSRNWTWLKANEPNCSKWTGSRNCMVCD